MPLAVLSLVVRTKSFPQTIPQSPHVLSLNIWWRNPQFVHLDHGLLGGWCSLQFHWGPGFASPEDRGPGTSAQ